MKSRKLVKIDAHMYVTELKRREGRGRERERKWVEAPRREKRNGREKGCAVEKEKVGFHYL